MRSPSRSTRSSPAEAAAPLTPQRRNPFRRSSLWWRAAQVVIAIVLWLFLVTLGHRLRHLWPPAADAAEVAAYVAAMTLWLSAASLIALRLLPFGPRPGRRGTAAIALWMALLALCHSLAHTSAADLAELLKDIHGMFGGLGFLIFVGAYGLLLALPFFPGVEIGIAIMAMFGARGALGAYLATVLGLTLAFGAGRLVPAHIGEALHGRLFGNAKGTRGEGGRYRAGIRLSGTLPPTLRALVRYRYPTLAVALNLPANAAIGGGGGVSLLAGISPLFAPLWFVATVAIATAPVPLLIGLGIIDTEVLMRYRGSVHDSLVWLEHVFRLR